MEHRHREMARDVLQCRVEIAKLGFGCQDQIAGRTIGGLEPPLELLSVLNLLWYFDGRNKCRCGDRRFLAVKTDGRGNCWRRRRRISSLRFLPDEWETSIVHHVVQDWSIWEFGGLRVPLAYAGLKFIRGDAGQTGDGRLSQFQRAECVQAFWVEFTAGRYRHLGHNSSQTDQTVIPHGRKG